MIDLNTEFAAVSSALAPGKSKLTQFLAMRPYRTLLIGIGVGLALAVVAHLVL